MIKKVLDYEQRFSCQSGNPQLTVPTLIIHSKEDEYIPFEQGYEIFTAANKKNTDFWEIKGPHIKGIFNYEKDYVNKFKNMVH